MLPRDCVVLLHSMITYYHNIMINITVFDCTKTLQEFPDLSFLHDDVMLPALWNRREGWVQDEAKMWFICDH